MGVRIRVELHDRDGLVKELKRLRQLRFEAVVEKNMTQIYQRGKRIGGTPVDTGELRQSLGMTKTADGVTVGYTKDYARHVEYGHRQQPGRFVPAIGKRLKRSWVPGQAYLKRNVDAQRPIYKQDLIKQLRGR